MGDVRAGNHQAHFSTEPIEVAFAVGEAWWAVISTDDDHGRVGKLSRFEFIEKSPDSSIPRCDFSEVIRKVLADGRHVG